MTGSDHFHLIHDIKIDVGQRIHDHRVIHVHAIKGIGITSNRSAVDRGCPSVTLVFSYGSRSRIDDIVEVSGHRNVFQQFTVHNYSNFCLFHVDHWGSSNDCDLFFDSGHLHGNIDGDDHTHTDDDLCSFYCLKSWQWSCEGVMTRGKSRKPESARLCCYITFRSQHSVRCSSNSNSGDYISLVVSNGAFD